jgi:O-antigen ligase
VIVISIGSFIATTNAENIKKVVLTFVQDAYLYAWFLMLVALLKNRGDQRAVRIAWLWAANIAGAIGMYMLLTNGVTRFSNIFGARGFRAVGLFNGPNELADYLMLSLFVVLSLSGQANRLLVWGSLAFQLLVVVATKSNGVATSWVLGMAVFVVIRLYTRTRSMLAVIAAGCLAIGVLLGAWVAVTELGLGGERLESLKKASFLGRFEHSAEGREQIWQRLIERYRKMPLGIGPGQSSEMRLSLGHRERKTTNADTYKSKEAHNDYLGYLVERGPLGLLGLGLLVVIPFFAVMKGYRKVADRAWRAGAGGAMAAAFAGGLVATTFHSLTMEKLHFRHYWLFLAIVFAFAAAPSRRLALAAVKPGKHRSSRRRSASRGIHRTEHHRTEHHRAGQGMTMEER